MGLFKKKINNDLIVSLANYEEADYQKASPDLHNLYNRITTAHNSFEEMFKKNLSSLLLLGS